uniref:O-glucosyltransferase rumi homolog n=1 Tax=Erigeron canadensis TaxID=72917 RepID=UPI001CB93D58|nr:O-glucosyltransferase rumi homolog [Erigeron canadensis]
MGDLTKTCPDNYYPKGFIMHDQEHISVAQHMCPEFFRWIHEDLKPWVKTGITKEMVERARKPATFRLVILNGRAYVEKYKKTIQTRDVFTIWGILQLLRRYPGKVPDLDLMFDCLDYPVIQKKDYHQLDSTLAPPPLFRYCSDDYSWDIVFPDWSFWGWAEINIKPWEPLLKDLDLGNKRTKWIDREPNAYWKGPWVAKHRKDLLKCNLSETQDWNARLYVQDWNHEAQEGFKQSHLANQCTHRFKIYIEGSAWSVSEKYILACDSMTLLVTPNYYDFFTRGLMPVQHYWPVKMDDKCRSIKFAVEWGNNHKQKVNEIGRAASNFIQEDLKMDNVYDYMFHLLSRYSRLMKYKPTVPQNAVELCSETMACTSEGLAKQFMEESTVKGPADVSPCIMQPPYDPQTLKFIHDRKMNSIKEVEKWEKDYYEKINQL